MRIIIVSYLFIPFPQYDKHDLKFRGLTFEDSGMYQCRAENRHGVVYADAELRVIGELNSLSDYAWLRPMQCCMC